MKVYERPIVEVSNETSEGVYAASGDTIGVCPAGRSEASVGVDKCQVCSATDGARYEPLPGEKYYRENYNGCPFGMPEKSSSTEKSKSE